DPALYKTLRGDGFEEATAFARMLHGLFPGNVCVQAVRMNENEEQLERFYREWKKEMDTVIVQKYDSFAGFLPDRKVTDLSPLTRFPCWHNKREMTVLIDGSVPLCREDLAKEHLLGNVFSDPIEKIWKNGEATYLSHIAGEYTRLCQGCDEYYTFNF
ncbi:MAG: spiro-SPASM protein, partial [Spirochaetaceae bacterium]